MTHYRFKNFRMTLDLDEDSVEIKNIAGAVLFTISIPEAIHVSKILFDYYINKRDPDDTEKAIELTGDLKIC